MNNPNWHYNRGERDAQRGKSPIFRATSHGIVPTTDDDMSDDWSEENRAEYLNGYARGCAENLG